MKPAVEWISSPRRPSELFPSNRATKSSGSDTTSSVEPSTNSPGWRMNGSSSCTSTSSVSASCGCLTSMYGYRALWKTRKYRSTRTSTLDGWSRASSYGSIPMRPSPMSRAMVRSLRTTPRFFHQRVGERGESLQERRALGLVQRRERLLERLVPARKPGLDALGGRRLEVDERPPAVIRVLPALDEAVVFEVARQLAHGGQREADRLRDLADR